MDAPNSDYTFGDIQHIQMPAHWVAYHFADPEDQDIDDSIFFDSDDQRAYEDFIHQNFPPMCLTRISDERDGVNYGDMVEVEIIAVTQ